MRVYILITGMVFILFGGVGIAFYSGSLSPEREGIYKLKEGKLYLEQGTRRSIRRSIRIFSSLVARFGKRSIGPTAVFNLGLAYEKIGLRKEAYIKFRELYSLSKYIDKALLEKVNFQLGKLQIIQNLSDEGLARLYNLLRTTKSHKLRAKIYLELGNYYSANGNFRKAKSSYEIALMENPYLDEARIRLSQAYIHLNKHFAGYEAYETYLNGQGNLSKNKYAVENNYKNAALSTAMSLYNSKHYFDAIKHFDVVYGKAANSDVGEEAAYFKAMSFKNMHDYNLAKKNFVLVRSNSNYKRDASALYQIAYIDFKSNSFAKAASTFQKFIAQYPNHNLKPKAQAYYNECIQSLGMESDSFGDSNTVSQDTDGIELQDNYLSDDFENDLDNKKIPADYIVKGNSSSSLSNEIENEFDNDDEGSEIIDEASSNDDEFTTGF